MKLIKSCRAEHNIFNNSRLLIGNLDAYRTSEDIDIADNFEARFDLSINFPTPTKVSSFWLSTILNGAMSVSERMHPPIGVDYTAGGGFSIELSNQIYSIIQGRIDFRYNLSNCYIFCMSDISIFDHSISSGYNSFWTIDEKNIERFGQQCANQIKKNFRLSDINRSRPPIINNSHLDKIKVRWTVKPVEYISGTFINISDENQLPIDRFFSILEETPFRKRIEYSPECEVRFVFRPYIYDYPISVANKRLFLKSMNLKNFAERYQRGAS